VAINYKYIKKDKYCRLEQKLFNLLGHSVHLKQTDYENNCTYLKTFKYSNCTLTIIS